MIEEKAIKPIPYAVSDFDKFRKKNYYYVDKTRYIRNIEEKGRYLLQLINGDIRLPNNRVL